MHEHPAKGGKLPKQITLTLTGKEAEALYELARLGKERNFEIEPGCRCQTAGHLIRQRRIIQGRAEDLAINACAKLSDALYGPPQVMDLMEAENASEPAAGRG